MPTSPVESTEPMRNLLLVLCLAGSPLPAQVFDHGRTAPAPESAARAEANTALEAHEYARALKLLEPLAQASPKDARLLYDLGSAEDALDQPTPAEASYRASIADDAAALEPRVALGLLLARAGKLPEARVELAASVALPAGDPLVKARAYRALARIDERNRPADARDELLEALKLSPETPEDTLLAAELAAAAGNGSSAAEAAYRRLLVERPNHPEAPAALAPLLVEAKRGAEAEPLLTAALAAHPGDPGLTGQLASVYGAEGKPERALPLVEGLHASHPQDANLARLLAGLYLDTHNYSAAEPLLATLNVQNPQDAVTADELGDALIHEKRFAEAETLLARVVGQPALWPSPESRGEAAGHLAFAASANNDPAGCLHALEVRATVLAPSAPVLFLSAISEDKLHHVKAAQQDYKAFLAASNGANPDEEFEAQHRLVALEHTK